MRNMSLISEQVGHSMNVDVFVFSDSVLCLGGKCAEYPGSVHSMVKHTSKTLRPKGARN